MASIQAQTGSYNGVIAAILADEEEAGFHSFESSVMLENDLKKWNECSVTLQRGVQVIERVLRTML